MPLSDDFLNCLKSFAKKLWWKLKYFKFKFFRFIFVIEYILYKWIVDWRSEFLSILY